MSAGNKPRSETNLERPKIFISCLGTGRYEKTKYESHEGESNEAGTNEDLKATPYIQLARLRALKQQQIELSGAYILVTAGAKEANWDKRTTPQQESKEGLAQKLENESLSAKLIAIPNGAKEIEFWEIFKIVSDLVPLHADIYVDLTHGFRTLPILLLLALEFVTKLKGAQIAEVTYGALPDKDTGISPTWNLHSFLTIKDWAQATSSFLEYGDTRPLATVAHKPIKALGRELRNNMPQGLSSLGSALDHFGEAISKCHSPSIGNKAASVKQIINTLIKDRDHIPPGPLQPLVELLIKVQDKLKDFPGEDKAMPGAQAGQPTESYLRAQWAAVKWCAEHNRSMQALTFLREGMVSTLGVACKSPKKAQDKDFGILTQSSSKQPLNQEDQGRLAQIEASHPFSNKTWNNFTALLPKLAKTRNKLNHAYNGHEDKAPLADRDFRQMLVGNPADSRPALLSVFSTMIDELYPQVQS